MSPVPSSAAARQRILARLQAAAPAQALPAPDVEAWYAPRRQAEDWLTRARRFKTTIEAAHAEVHEVSAGGWVQKLWEVLAARHIKEVLIAPGTAHGQRAAEVLPPSGITTRGYDAPIEGWKEELFHYVPASLTAARSAIAETGTLILWPDVQEPRLMSLVPPVHVVLLDAQRIHATLHDAMRDEAWADGLPTNSLLISGPSKTADIQQTLAYGAHGPKELIVLLVGDWLQKPAQEGPGVRP